CGLNDDAADFQTGMFQLDKYRIVGKGGATVRQGYSIKTELVQTLPYGTVVEVSEVQGLRACIVHPVQGWASLGTEKGYVIMDKITQYPRYRVIYEGGITVRSGPNIDKSRQIRHLSRGEVVEGTGNIQKYDGVERIELVGGGWISKNTREDGGVAGEYLIERA
ncbi:unnamed protein product, partial [Heterosigma akashiwo]